MPKDPPRDIRSYFNLKSAPAKARALQSPLVELARSNPSSRARPTAQPAPSARPVNQAPTVTQNPPQDKRGESLPPTASQSSSHSAGTKRVVSNGEPIVLNSDSDTDSDGLLELELNLLKPTHTPRTVGAPSRVTRSTPYIELLENGLRRPSDKNKRPKPSLDKYIKDVQERAETDRKVAQGKADLDKDMEEMPPPDFIVTEEALAEQIENDKDENAAKRIFIAMQRTNALDTNRVFHFFHENSSKVQDSSRPMASLPPQGWASQFENPWERDQAFCSGFAQQVFQYQQLPVDLALWMIDQVCLGESDILSVRYIQLLEAHPQHLHTLIDRSKLDNMFKVLGADLQYIESTEPFTPCHENEYTPKRQLPDALKWVVLLLQKATLGLPYKTNIHALYILFVLCFDDSVMSDVGVLGAVQDTIEVIMRNISSAGLTAVLTEIVPLLLERITHPIVQNNLVHSLPSKSPLTAYFQRHLALSMLLHPTRLQIPLSSPQIPPLIYAHLQTSPDFRITNETDYTSLAALISLLDTGIGPGPLTVPYQSPPTSPSLKELPPPASTSSEELTFNKEVGALVNHVKLLSNNIVEVGAIDDFTRLDAKDCCERLYHRLENAVRIGGRKRTPAFGDSTQGASRQVFRNWLNRKNVDSTALSL